MKNGGCSFKRLSTAVTPKRKKASSSSFLGGYVPGSEITARTPLCFATKDGLEEIVTILLEAGADVNQHDEW